jgi:hypothetical protein
VVFTRGSCADRFSHGHSIAPHAAAESDLHRMGATPAHRGPTNVDPNEPYTFTVDAASARLPPARLRSREIVRPKRILSTASGTELGIYA